MAALSVSIPATESDGQGRKGSADPSSGNFTSPFASKGTCVLEFGQGGGFSQPPWRSCVSVCVHGCVLEERCVCVALGEEGSCSSNSRASGRPKNLGFLFSYYNNMGLVQGVMRRELFFFFFFILIALEAGFEVPSVTALHRALLWGLASRIF